MKALALAVALAGAAIASAGCGGGGEGSCVEVDLSCQPLYEPTFDQIHERTLVPKCALSGTACHSSEGAKNGLSLEDPDTAYELLLRSRTTPGDPSCSLLVRRIESSDADFQMPPGSPLGAAERCAIIQWVEAGAER